MQQGGILIGVAAFLVLVVGPLLFGLMGITRFRGPSVGALRPVHTWDWNLTVTSEWPSSRGVYVSRGNGAGVGGDPADYSISSNWVEVVAVPVVVTMIGIGWWIQATAWAVSRVNVGASLSSRAIAYAGSALLILLPVFQLLLIPAIRFY